VCGTPFGALVGVEFLCVKTPALESMGR
jgi:hypothetical protein